jgi:hypothetical protein
MYVEEWNWVRTGTTVEMISFSLGGGGVHKYKDFVDLSDNCQLL